MKNKKLVALLALAVVAFAALTKVDMVSADDLSEGYGRAYKVFVNTTTETLVCSGPCVLDGVLMSSGATTNYLIFADSAGIGGGGTNIIPQLFMPGAGKNDLFVGLGPVLFKYGITVDAAAADSFGALIKFHRP